jgi:Fe-S-cluster-containing hydrogenase component 2
VEKKRKYCEKEKNENRETILNISNNSPRILVAEKSNKKETIFCLKCLGLGA